MTILDEIEAAIPSLRRYARALVRDGDLADDLVQDCLERALRRRALWRQDGPAKAWLFRILLNRFRDEHRRNRKTLRLVEADNTVNLAGPSGQEAHMALRETHEAMGRLPEEQRAALLLVALEGMTIAEAAAVLSLKEGTLASRLARARAALRQMTGRGDDIGPAAKKEMQID